MIPWCFVSFCETKFVLLDHQDNMSVCFIPPYTPLLYSKTGVYRGIHYFLIFCSKTYIVGTR